MSTIKLLLTTVFLSLVLGQFGRLPFLSGAFNLYLLDLAVFVLVFVINLYLLVSGKIRKASIDAVFILGFCFVFWSLLTFLYNAQWLNLTENILGFFYLLRFSMYFWVYFSLKQVFLEGGYKLKEWFINLLVLVGILISIAGFIQLVILPDLSDLAATEGYDPHKNRLVSSFLDPNFTGAFLVLTLNLLLSSLVVVTEEKALELGGVQRGNLLRWLAVVVLIAALILTFSRSAWLMFAVSVLLLGIIRLRVLLFIAVFIAFSAYFLVPRVQTRISGITDPDDSAKLRFVSWQRTMTIASNNLFFGVGFNNFRSAQEDYGFFDYNLPEGGRAGGGSDSSLLLVLATTGIPGLLLYWAFYLSMIVKSLRGTIAKDKISLASFVSLIGLLFESNFVNSLFFTPIVVWIFSLISAPSVESTIRSPQSNHIL